MLSQCANPQCCKPFLRLREGKLFLVETGGRGQLLHTRPVGLLRAREMRRQVERFWLCDQCAACWTLVYDQDQGVALAPLRRPVLNVSLPRITENAIA